MCSELRFAKNLLMKWSRRGVAMLVESTRLRLQKASNLRLRLCGTDLGVSDLLVVVQKSASCEWVFVVWQRCQKFSEYFGRESAGSR